KIAAIVAMPIEKRSDVQKTALALHVLREQVAKDLAGLPPPQMVYAAANDFKPQGNFTPAKTPRPIHVLKRGDINSPEEAIASPGALSCIPGLECRFKLDHPEDEGTRRATLAKWISDPRNPLTWRSIVN